MFPLPSSQRKRRAGHSGAVSSLDDDCGCACCGFFFFVDRTMVEILTLNSLSELYYAGLYAHDMSEKMAVLFELQKK